MNLRVIPLGLSLSLLLASSAMTGCAATEHDTNEPEAAQAELSRRQPSRECAGVARAAVQAIEGVNDRAVTITREELVSSHGDRELVRISIGRSPSAGAPARDSYLVSTESMGGSPCLVYGLQLKSEQIDLLDDGAVLSSGPSAECKDIAVGAVKAIGAINGERLGIVRAELAAAHSDRELVRVHVEGPSREADSYLVNTESMGGSPCLVYGVQLKSQEGVPTIDE